MSDLVGKAEDQFSGIAAHTTCILKVIMLHSLLFVRSTVYMER